MNNLLLFTALWGHFHHLAPKHFHHTKRRPCTHEVVSLRPLPPPQPLATTDLLSRSFRLYGDWVWRFHINGIIHSVAFGGWHNVFKASPCYGMNLCFVPFRGWIVCATFCLSIVRWCAFRLFTSSSYCVNSAAVNICVQVSVWTTVSVLLGIYLGVEFLGHMVTLYLISWRNLYGLLNGLSVSVC